MSRVTNVTASCSDDRHTNQLVATFEEHANSLSEADLDAVIEAEDAQWLEGVRIEITRGIRIGVYLNAKKRCLRERLGHGSWLSWIAAHGKMKRRRYAGYMRAARLAKEHPGAHLETEGGIAGFLRAFSRPRRRKRDAQVRRPELVPVTALKEHPRNYKRHPPEQIAHLIQSIAEFGFCRNVIVARDLTILAGHGAVQAVREMGAARPTRVPVVRLDLDPNDPKALKLMVADNEIALSAAVSDRALTEIVKEVGDAGTLLGTGYDRQSLAARVFASRGASEIPDQDAAAQWAAAGMPEHDGRSGVVKLIIDFESVAVRETFVAEHDITLNSSDATKPNVSAWWPPRRKHDVSSLRWDTDVREVEAVT